MIKIQDIAKSLSEKHNISLSEATKFLNTLFDVLNDSLRNERQVKIKGLGTFKITSVKERNSIDVNTGERVVIGRHDKVSFIPETSMRDFVNKPFSQFETVVVNDGVKFDDIEETTEETDIDDLVDEDVVDNIDKPVTANEPSVVTEKLAILNEKEIIEDKDEISEESKTQSEEIKNNDQEIVLKEEKEQPKPENQNDPIMERNNKRSWKLSLAFLLVAAVSFATGFLVCFYGIKNASKEAPVSSKNMKEETIVSSGTTEKPVDTVQTVVKEPTMKVESETPKNENAQEATSLIASDYDAMNKKITYGAYNIVGVSTTIKIRKGQTMKSIAKTFLGGEQMECYIQALNGVSTVVEGQEIKIPKLQVRRNKKN